jgi:hypothetical protein
MDSDAGCSGCLSIVATVFGIVSGGITVVAYFFPESDSLLETLGDVLPSLAEPISSLAGTITEFAESWPLGPWLSALLLFLAIGVLRYVAEVVLDLMTVDVSFSGVLAQATVFLPLALLWIWIFSGVASTFALVAFLVGYVLSIVVSIFVASELGW